MKDNKKWRHLAPLDEHGEPKPLRLLPSESVWVEGPDGARVQIVANVDGQTVVNIYEPATAHLRAQACPSLDFVTLFVRGLPVCRQRFLDSYPTVTPEPQIRQSKDLD